MCDFSNCIHVLIFTASWRPRTKAEKEHKRSPKRNSKDWGVPQEILCTKSMGGS